MKRLTPSLFLLVLFSILSISSGAQNTSITNQPPIANAGFSRYLGYDPIRLDGSRSYDPDGTYEVLSYHWRQVSGPPLQLNGSNSAEPQVSAFTNVENNVDARATTASPFQRAPQRCVFELIVSDGQQESEASLVEVTLVADYGNQVLELVNPPFDSMKPTLIVFGGGNGVTGRAYNLMTKPLWVDSMNIFTVEYGPPYELFADSMIAYLSSVAPDYDQMIQLAGYSTGGQPASMVSQRLNSVYADPRFWVNRISLIDACCRSYSYDVSRLLDSKSPGEPFWIENFWGLACPYLSHTLNISFPDHGTPSGYFRKSSDAWRWPNRDLFNGGLYGGFYASVAGPAKNLQLVENETSYDFLWIEDGNVQHRDADRSSGKLPQPIQLRPVRTELNSNDASLVLSCEFSQNVVRYELLMGADPRELEVVEQHNDASAPTFQIDQLPYEPIFWSIRGYDANGSTIHSDPRPINNHSFLMPVHNIDAGLRYATIQDAVDEAEEGVTIVLEPGVYQENIEIRGKSLVLRSINPTNPKIVQDTIIRGGQGRSSVSLDLPEGEGVVSRSEFHGITITGDHCGLFLKSGQIVTTHCKLISNKRSGVRLGKNTKLIMDRCIVSENLGHGIVGYDDIDEPSTLQLSHCIIAGNSQNGIYGGNFIGGNCTIAENIQSGISCRSLQLSNSIVYFNCRDGSAHQIKSPSPIVHYSNIENNALGDTNIDTDPLFVQFGASNTVRKQLLPRGDYHLKSVSGRWNPVLRSWVGDDVHSPSIDAGSPSLNVSKETIPNGDRVNQGAYGGTVEASRS